MALSSISAILCVGAIEDANTVCGHSSHKKGTVPRMQTSKLEKKLMCMNITCDNAY